MSTAPWVVLLLLVGACQHIDEAGPQLSVPTLVREKNYQLNEPQYAYVGAPMIRVKDYHAIRNIQDAAVASNDFTVSPTVGFSKTGRKGSSYKIIGTTDYKGRTYRVLQMERYGLMLDENGTPINSVIDLSSGLHNVFVPSFSISPPDTTFNVSSDTMVDKGKPFTYYELLYSGIEGNSLRMVYHEYSPDNLVRPAFVQELTYPVFQSELTFRNLKLEILSSDSQQVWFMVVDDRGASAAPSSSMPTSPSTSGPRMASGIGSGVHGAPFRRRRRRACFSPEAICTANFRDGRYSGSLWDGVGPATPGRAGEPASFPETAPSFAAGTTRGSRMAPGRLPIR